MRSWTAEIDPTTIPDDVLKSERARRNALKRESYTGGIFWKRHNPGTARCRCKSCMERRQPNRYEDTRILAMQNTVLTTEDPESRLQKLENLMAEKKETGQ